MSKTSLRINSANLTNDNAAICRTSTFYMHIPAAAGEKIALQKLQTTPDGNFIAAGSITLADNEQEGLILTMNNAGVILSQKRLRINGKSTDLYSIKVMLTGDMVIAGTIEDGTNSIFIAKLQPNLSTSWIQTFTVNTSPLKVTLDLLGTDQIALGVQLAASVVYSNFNVSGSLLWSHELPVDNLVSLAGFTNFTYESYGLVINCLQNNKQAVKIVELKNDDGSVRSSFTTGDGSEENKCMDVTYFAQTLDMACVLKTGTNFQLVRNLADEADKIQTHHTYKTSNTTGFNITAAMDNAGDAMGYCFPDEGKLVFIKQFAYYYTTPDFTREYTIPKGSGITAVTRSLQDGGFLFSLNTADNKESILIKTDSIGTLPGCGYNDVVNTFLEETNTLNTAVTYISNSSSFPLASASVTLTNTLLTPVFSCNQIYCPPPPPADSCLSTYYKTLRSNSYIDFFASYYLMRNNRQIALTARYDRVLGDGNQTTEGLKLFDENGQFIKGVNIFQNGVSSAVDVRQMDDKSIMVISYSNPDDIPCFTFTLVSDDLQIIWSKTIKTYQLYEFNPSGTFFDDLIKDDEGNYYFITNSTKFFDIKSKVLVYKMDASGNEVWLKAYEMHSGSFGIASATTTKSSLIVILEGNFDEGSGSVRIDKTTGEMLNSFLYNNRFDGGLYNRLVKYSNDKIFYASTTGDGQILLGTFDTTGRPLKLKYISNSNTSPRAFNTKDGMLYMSYNFYDGNTYKDILVKADTALNIVFMNEYNIYGYKLAMGLGISDNGSIYTGGNSSYQGYFDPYLVKYSSDGQLGTCSYTALHPQLINVDPQVVTNNFSAVQRAFTAIDIPVTFVPDIYGQAIGSVLCSSAPQCTTVKISGPDAICNLNENYAFYGKKNSGCLLQPVWLYDTSYASLNTATDDTALLSFKKTGNTFIAARLNTGCKYFDDSIKINIQKAPAFFSLGNDTLFCPGDSIRLNAGSGFNTYKWQDGSTDSVYNVKKAGAYNIRVDNVCSDVFKDTVVITQAIISPLNIGNDTTICKGDTLLLSASPDFVKYYWLPQSLIKDQAKQVVIKPTQNSLIKVAATSKDGCFAADSLIVSVISPRPVSLGSDTSFCTGDSIVLSAGTGYLHYSWSTGSNTSAVVIKQAGSYWIHAKDANGCFADDTLAVQTLYPKPVINLGADKDLCFGSVKILNAGNYSSYHWQDNSNNQYYTVSAPGTYYVSVINNNNCIGSDTFTVSKFLPIPANFLKPTDSICGYDKVQLRPLETYESYKWSTRSIEPVITVGKAGTYTLIVKDKNGCIGYDTIQIIQKNCLAGVFIPNAFTPNKDGLNDLFKATVYGVTIAFQLDIFDRFDELVFSTNDPQKGWDGNYKGKPLDTGTFVWKCNYYLEGSRPVFDEGTVVLIR